MSARSLHVPASRRSHVTMVSVKNLVAMVREGRIRIPAYQRPLRWKAADVLKLFDSIWRGFPVGLLTFWQHEAPAGKELVGDAEILVPACNDAWWVVDGQQRITSLAAALIDFDRHYDRRWDVYFNPIESCFEPWSQYLPDHFVPTVAFGDLRRFLLWVRQHDLDPMLMERIEDARQQLLEYNIPAYVMDTNDAEAIQTAFVRINGSGASMRADEMFHALMAHPAQERSRLDLDGLQAACDRNDFGMPSRADVMKAVLAMSGIESFTRIEHSPLDPIVSYEDAEIALKKTVVLLQERCGIPHVRLIPFMGVLHVLARWFHVHEDPEPAAVTRLAQWVWRASALAAQQQPLSSWAREQLRAIRDGDEQASLDRLDGLAGSRPFDEWKLARFNPRTVRSRIEILALVSAKPRDTSGPLPLRELLSRDRIAREIIGSRDRPVDLFYQDLVGTAANRALLDSMDTNLHREFRTWDPVTNEEALRSHLIAPGAFAALQELDYDEFLRLRAAAVENHVARFLESHARWDDPVVRPHRYYSDEALDSEVLG